MGRGDGDVDPRIPEQVKYVIMMEGKKRSEAERKKGEYLFNKSKALNLLSIYELRSHLETKVEFNILLLARLDM